MRLVFVFHLVASLAVSARPLAQTVTFSESNASATRVIAAIEKQTDYLVFFTLNLLENAKPVSISAYKMPLVEFMTAFVKDQPFGFRIDGRTIFLTEKMEEVSAASKSYIPLADLLAPRLIKGRVRSQEGASLPGVTFSKNKLPVGTSGSEGRFELTVEEGDTISVTAVGYHDLQFKVTSNARDGFRAVQLNSVSRLNSQKEQGEVTGSYIQNANNEIIVVMVPSFSSLNEVVVNTGYQALPKERATGSFVFVGKEQLNKRTDARIMDRLVGYVPGLQLDRRLNSDTRSKTQYNIRGLNTFMGALDGPLIIVNGFPYDGEIDLINPMDVESVTILKDAAATSIWGARAANGVIVIELKKNNTKSPFQLTFGANVNIAEKKDLWYRKKMNSSDFIDLEMEMFNKGYFDTDLSAPTARLRVTSPLVNMLNDHRNGIVSDKELNDQVAKWRNTDYRNEYSDLFLQNPVRQNYNLGISGGNHIMSYLVSGSYDRSLSENKGDYENRYTLRMVTEIKPVKNLSIEIGLLYINNVFENSNTRFSSDFRVTGGKSSLYPYAEFQGPDGEALAIPYIFNKRFIDTAGGGKLLDYSYRPLDEIGLNSSKTRAENINLTARIKYNFNSKLSAEIRYGIDKQSTTSESINDVNSFTMRDMINRWTQIDGDRLSYILPKGSRIIVSDQDDFKHQFRGQLTYNNRWNGVHEIAAFVASEISQNKGSGASSSAYGYDREYKTSIPVDYVNAYPTFGGIYGNFKIPGSQGFSGNNNRMVSFIGNAAYTFDGKYVFTISGRRDASNVLGLNTNEKWKPLWSSGLAWQIHKEKFFHADWVDVLKARITYGHSGNIFPGNGYYPIINFSNAAYFTNYTYANISTPPNPDMKWEDTRMINYGLDFALFNNRLSGSVEYYDKKSTDLIALSQLDPSSGLVSMNKNVGMLTGSGWDIILNSVNIQTNDFSWTSAFSLSYMKNRVRKYYGYRTNGYNLINGGENANIMEGYQMYTVFSFRSAGLDPLTGDPRGYDRNTGEISKNYAELFQDSVQHLVVNGPGMPPFTGFLRNAFRYKNFDLSFNLMYKFGGYFKEEMYSGNAFGDWDYHGNYEGRWKAPGDEKHTYIPSTVYPLDHNRTNFAAYSSDFIHKADYIRLSDIRIGYSFTVKTAAKPVILNLFAGARDLGLIWKANKIDIDPESIYYRTGSSVNIGCNVTF